MWYGILLYLLTQKKEVLIWLGSSTIFFPTLWPVVCDLFPRRFRFFFWMMTRLLHFAGGTGKTRGASRGLRQIRGLGYCGRQAFIGTYRVRWAISTDACVEISMVDGCAVCCFFDFACRGKPARFTNPNSTRTNPSTQCNSYNRVKIGPVACELAQNGHMVIVVITRSLSFRHWTMTKITERKRSFLNPSSR